MGGLRVEVEVVSLVAAPGFRPQGLPPHPARRKAEVQVASPTWGVGDGLIERNVRVDHRPHKGVSIQPRTLDVRRKPSAVGTCL